MKQWTDKFNKVLVVCFLGASMLLLSCGASSPVEQMQSDLSGLSEYSIILDDMNQEGNFFPEYYHKYKVVTGQVSGGDTLYETNVTDWQRVREEEYDKYKNNLGMIIAGKSPDGEAVSAAHPPGYQYVGNPQYGQWKTDNSGNSFWEFYGKYALISHMFGMFNRPVYYNDWDDYRGRQRSGRPYYGKNNEYGTSGSHTKKSNPTFFQRRQAQETARKESFQDKVRKRTKRSNMSNTRRRSSGYGK